MAIKRDIIKTAKELNILNKQFQNIEDIQADVLSGNYDSLTKSLKVVEKLKKTEADREAILNEIRKHLEAQQESFKQINNKEAPNINKALKMLDNTQNSINKQTESWEKSLKAIHKIFDGIIKQNKEIFEISHNIQTEGNLTWRQFSRLYEESYQAARRMNQEFGQSLVTAKDLIEVQNKLLSEGWRNIDTSTLTDISGSMRLLQQTLGGLDARLIQAFQTSYTQFGSQTDTFITRLGNRLNAFSDSFGMTVGMLQGVVAESMSVNTFMARSNMEAQLRANESLLQAAALSSQMGVTSLGFLNQLISTASFGTAEELIPIYQSGAVLQGFDTREFLNSMSSPGGQYDATKNLVSSIYSTLSGMEDNPLLRNEYMRMIQSGFGFSQNDLIEILNRGENFDTYDEAVQDRLLNTNNSMLDELKDLKQTLVERFDRWWGNSSVSETLGKWANEFGLYGVTDWLQSGVEILKSLWLLQQLTGGKGLGSLGGLFRLGAAGGMGTALGGASENLGGLMIMPTSRFTGAQRLGGAVAGGLIAYGGNQIGSEMISSNVGNNVGNNVGGWGINLLSGIGGGALTGYMASGGNPIGALAGGIIGLGYGLVKSFEASEQRDKAMWQLELDDRARRRASGDIVSSGDPVVDAINAQTRALENAISGSTQAHVNLTSTLEFYKTGSTKDKLQTNLGK